MERYHFTARMLGGFSLSLNEELVSQPLDRSKKAKHLLAYLLYHRSLVSTNELHEIFWPQVKNPKNALKVLVHRLRAALHQGGVPDHIDCIIQRQGGYEWNPALSTSIDLDQFEHCYREATSGRADRSAQAASLQRGISLYRGHFLQNDDAWMAEAAESLHQAYRKMVQLMCTLYREDGCMEELVTLCREALRHDPMDEMLNRELIAGLLACGRSQEAIRHYRHLADLYKRDLGTEIPAELQSLYQHILETEGGVELNIDSIRGRLEEKAPSIGAFVCDYDIFRDIYRIQARCLDRYGGRVYLALLTVSSAHSDHLSPRILARQMDLLLDVTRASLRRGDVIARFSASQYVLLLPMVTEENGMQVLERIRQAFRCANPKSPVAILGMLRPLRPPGEDCSC